VDFSFDRPADNPHLVITTLTASSAFGLTLSDFLFQAAVPKVLMVLLFDRIPPETCVQRCNVYALDRHSSFK
jgi:hypothetical protein